jgi:thiosulfate/3-mercaptopyruvate sulfurtransferase
MSPFAHPELLATTEWLGGQLERGGVHVLDVRWRPDGTGAAVHAAGHIPGSTHVDWRADLCEPRPEGDARGGFHLAAPDRMAAAMSRAGVGDGSTVVVYDDAVSLHAARVWWSLRAYGFASARILDGGFPAWVAERRPVAVSGLPRPAATFTPRLDPRTRLETDDVRALLGSPDVRILDGRAAAEYRGFEGNAWRLGHIPGAVNVPVGAMHEPGSQRLRPADQLRDLLLPADLGRGRRIVCYDGAGVASAKLAFVLTLLGHAEVAVYDGGWADWGDRLDLPVDR